MLPWWYIDPSSRHGRPRGAVIFIVWFHRAYGNLPALGVSNPRRGRGWAIGAWFIPIANLFIPKQMANDIWRAGDPELRPGDYAWQSRPVAAILHWWWALGVVKRATARQESRARLLELQAPAAA